MLQKARTFTTELFQEFMQDRVTRQAAALAYYTIFAIAPLLLVAIGVAGFFFGQQEVQQDIIQQASETIGENGANLIEDVLNATYESGSGVIATIISLVFVFIGASNIFNQLKLSLNHIWGVPSDEGGGLVQFLRGRLIAVLMVIGVGLILLLSLVVSAVVPVVLRVVEDIAPGVPLLTRLLDLLVAVPITTLLFALAFKFLPDVHIEWGDVWVGAFVTAILFEIGKLLINVYISLTNVASAYGAAGSLIIVLVWAYYLAVILLLGAEFTQVYARMFGSKIEIREGYIDGEA